MKWLSAAATLAMLALLAWLGASIFWRLTTPATVEPVVAIETNPARIAQTVTARHLFGEAPPPSAVLAKGKAPTDIKLRGVIAPSRPGQPAVAVLSIGGKASISVREGEEPVPGITLHRVFAREVEIKRNGQIQSLSLPDRQPAPVAGAPPPPAAPQRGKP
ncbi:MAG TPA: type II secretion system protein N [Burkholderiales bacterium]|nr:type II secretion system protein N [Burkholderiales bacterium]